MAKQNPSKPNVTKDYVPKEDMIKNIKDNMRVAEVSKEFAGPEELEHLEEKNQRRIHEIERLQNKPLS
ncbi:small acid-soluble spore protein Tlp [Ureibacillus composti]|uniref:Small acid-soluble spore protein Tlp n=1 Tax=Lysinibacillus composti TaxID=720633 RepID=A0A3N9UQR6_9BACI|nr:small acid-soluble spore protein Tlp [Lysinibacillus composti]MBM7609198.1 small acid-soluble spore protein (thioredoxin-like protein) [Lysinibacillus composti]MDM5332180.1 small acid-soluble spore protein Tlp [Ureibacillus composti]RQW74246.1 small acid-soluble spore protein Tlp [Lysinibacillus composti]